MMSESKIAATKVARLGVLVLALLAALVAVQTFGAKPAEASLGPSVVVRVIDDAARARLVEELEDPARPKVPEPEVAPPPPVPDYPYWQGADTEALKSKIEDSTEYVKEGGCAIVEVAAVAAEMEDPPPTDDQVRYMVETNVPTKYFLVVSPFEEDLITLEKHKRVESELVEINHLVRDMMASYSNDEPDVASEMLSKVIDGVCSI